jgi:SMI1 / KNR4 family (SUKH-1)
MKSDDYASLCERIRDHCHQQQWYGPDLYRDQHTFNWGPDESWIRHDFRTRFFPPATEEQLRLSEEAMGFPYPPLLRTLYLRLANGGFGPAYGLVGAFGGYADAIHTEGRHEFMLQESVVYPSFSEEITLIDIEQCEKPGGDRKKIYIDPAVWPKHLIELCEWGCGYFSLLHAPSGRVYYFGEDYLFQQANSLEEWLERWLRGENLEQVNWT